MVECSPQPDLIPTRFARLTAAGRSAVATVAVFGPEASDHVCQYFRPASGKSFSAIPVGQVVFGRWISARGTTEELVVCRYHENRVDVHCHGGDAAVETIENSLASSGCIAGQSQELMAYEHQDRLAIEAWQAMSKARTRRGALLMLTQYHGALRQRLAEILAAMQAGQLGLAREVLQRMQKWVSVGLHVTCPWEVVLVGPPNVGKSSLVNMLLGFRRSIVDDQPGTTRDLLTTCTAWDGWPIELIDTAGVREDAEGIEQEGIDKVWQHQRQVDLVVLVLDCQQDWSSVSQRLLESVSEPLVVYNKSDLLKSAGDRESVLPGHSSGRPPGILTSAVTGDGLDRLIDEMLRRLVPVAPGLDEAVPFTEVQSQLIGEVLELLQNGQVQQAIHQLHQFLQANDSPTVLLQDPRGG